MARGIKTPGVSPRNKLQGFIRPEAEKRLTKKCKEYGVVYQSGLTAGLPRRGKMVADIIEYLTEADARERKAGKEVTIMDKILSRVYKDGIPS